MRRGLLAHREELEALRSRLSHRPFDGFHERLEQRCALILESSPAREMHWQSAWATGRWNAALTAARGAQGRILDLVIADAVDRNDAYRSRAVEELTNLAHWSTWVDPSRSDLRVDLCTAEAAVAAVVGLDWLWDELSEALREEILGVLRARVLEPYRASVAEDVWWRTAVNHWNAVINSACGLVGLALGDEDAAAENLYLQARKGLSYFFDDLGREGGWDEGIGYWGYAIRSVLLFAEACARVHDDQSLLHQRGMDVTGLFPIYFSPNGVPVSFGDTAELPLHGALYLLDKHFNRSEVTWWLDEYAFSHDVSTFGWSKAGLSLLYRSVEIDEPPEPKLEPVKEFSQIGWATMADSWPRPGFYAALKTGDLAVSHAQHDMNSLQLQVDGEMMLVDLGHPGEEGTEYFSVARSTFYEVQARAHNTLIVGAEDHRPDAQGRIAHTAATDAWRWVVCDAHQACGEFATFHRHAVMLLDARGDGRSLVVLDEIDLLQSQQVDLFWHVGGSLTVDAKTMRGCVKGRRADLYFALAATAPATLSTTETPLNHRRWDRYLQLTGDMSGRNYLLSVFSRRNIKTAATLEVEETAEVRVRFDKTSLLFQPDKTHLRLADVASR
jgi:hypothetical protein